MKTGVCVAGVKMFIAVTLMGCSTAMVMNKRLPSEWNISNYEERMADGSANSVRDIGSMRFETNGTGTKSINFKIIERNIEDYQPFEWKVAEDTVYISGTSHFSRPWTIVNNTAGNQVWKSKDNKLGITYTMVLNKNRPEQRISQRTGNE